MKKKWVSEREKEWEPRSINLGKFLILNMNPYIYIWWHPSVVFFSTADEWQVPTMRHPQITVLICVTVPWWWKKNLLILPFTLCLRRGWLRYSPNWLCLNMAGTSPKQVWWEKGPAGPWLHGYCVFIIIHIGLRGQHCLGWQKVSLKTNPQKQQQEPTVWQHIQTFFSYKLATVGGLEMRRHW